MMIENAVILRKGSRLVSFDKPLDLEGGYKLQDVKEMTTNNSYLSATGSGFWNQASNKSSLFVNIPHTDVRSKTLEPEDRSPGPASRR